MANMTAKNFIETLFVHQVGEIVPTQPYIAFMIMGIGIEFLGKCLNPGEFDEERVSRIRFEEAISQISALSKYRGLIGKDSKFDLYSSLRCGLAHVAAPKYPITLSSKNEMPHLELHDNGNRINLKCEDFYIDFRQACEEVINMSAQVEQKLSQPFLSIPDTPIETDKLPTAITQSLSF